MESNNHITTVEQTTEATASHEESTVASSTIIFNVGVQVINILIFFFAFKYFFGKKILKSFDDRRWLMDKLRNADDEYRSLLEKAQEEKRKIVDEWKTLKDNIVKEAEQLATKKKEDILADANKKSQDILDKAQADANNIKQELEDNWENGVKTTAKVVVKKLLEQDVDLQQKYLDKLLWEFGK